MLIVGERVAIVSVLVVAVFCPMGRGLAGQRAVTKVCRKNYRAVRLGEGTIG